MDNVNNLIKSVDDSSGKKLNLKDSGILFEIIFIKNN
jgi:hypothetical protein